MRTTLTLEDHLAAQLQAAARKRKLPFKQIVNDALRRGLASLDEPRKAKSFRIKPVSMGVKAGIDYDKINQLLDDMEAEHTVSRMKGKR